MRNSHEETSEVRDETPTRLYAFPKLTRQIDPIMNVHTDRLRRLGWRCLWLMIKHGMRLWTEPV